MLMARLPRLNLAGNPALRPILTMGVGSIAVAAINLMVGAITARVLGPEGRGDLLILTLYAATGSNLLVLGLDVVIPQLMRRHGLGRTDALALAAMATAAATAAAGLVVLAASITLESHPAEVISGHALPFLMFFAASHLSIVYQSVIVTEENYRLYTRLRVAMPVVILAGALFCLLVGFGLGGLFLAFVAGAMIYPLAALRSAVTGPPRDPRYSWEPALFRRYGAPAAVLQMARVAEVNSIGLAVTMFGTRSDAGLYAVAMVAANVVVILSEALSRYAFGNALAAGIRTGDEFRAWFRRLRGIALILLGLSLAVAGPLVWLLVPYVFGEAFTPARQLVLPLMAASLLGAISNIYVEIAKSQGLAHIAILPRLTSAALVFAAALLSPSNPDFLIAICGGFVLAQGCQLIILHIALSRRFGRMA